MNNTENDNFGDNNVTIVTTPIQTVKTLQIHELDFYYHNQDKLKG